MRLLVLVSALALDVSALVGLATGWAPEEVTIAAIAVANTAALVVQLLPRRG